MELKLPLLGDVMTEGKLVSWLQASGTLVSAGAPLYQIETDKVTLTVDAPETGVLERLVREGETVPVGTVVGRLVRADPDSDEAEVRASPAARRLARELAVDLAALDTSRRIREADVQAYYEAHRVPEAAAGAQLSGRRKVIAERMRSSLQQTAQLTISMEVDMSAAVELRAQLKQLLPEPQQPTMTDLVIRAVTLALRDHPRLNATFENGVLQVYEAVHLGIAVDAEEGLIVPVVRNAHQLPLSQLAEETKRLARRARDNELTLHELQGGTFTVTSLGPQGVDFFTPIINPPQVAILGIGRLFAKLVLEQDRPVQRQAMYLSLSFDHQVVDGAPAARFVQRVKGYLELPASLVL